MMLLGFGWARIVGRAQARGPWPPVRGSDAQLKASRPSVSIKGAAG